MPNVALTSWAWATLMLTLNSAPLEALDCPAVSAASILERRNLSDQASTSHGFGETPSSRAGYTIVSLACMAVLAGMIGYRASHTQWSQLSTFTFTHYLIFVLYVFSMAFVLSAAVVESGLGLSSLDVCTAAIILCLAFYVGSKVIMYLFLVERAHALRAPYLRRAKDWLWVSGTLFIAVGFGSIAVCGFLWPISDVSSIDGKCRIGLPESVTIPLLSYDVLINTLLTLIFIYLLSPLVLCSSGSAVKFPATRLTRSLGTFCKSSRQRGVDLQTANPQAVKRMERLLWRTFVGCFLVLIPTVANMVQLTVLKGRELGWVCLTFCTMDVTWTVCIFHWLTIVSSEFDDTASAESVSELETIPEIFRRPTAFW